MNCMDNHEKPKLPSIFVNLHAAYDLVFIKFGEREYNFDRAGRLLWIYDDNSIIERSLNNRFVKKEELGFDSIYKHAKLLTSSEAFTIFERMQKDVNEILSKINTGELNREESLSPNTKNIINFLNKVTTHHFDILVKERELFESIYNSIEIFPSDLDNPLYLQLTEGCAYNRCTFCDFYKYKKFRIKSLEEFKRHTDMVKNFLGDSIQHLSSIFLGDANALMIEQEMLLKVFDLINQEFAHQTKRGINSFIDALYGIEKSEADFVELKKRNLKKIYVGLESGSNTVLSFVKKCNSAEAIIELTQKIKTADINIGIMIIAGLGGDKYYKEHVEETINVLNNLNLDFLDSINFSHLTLTDNTLYKKLAKKDGIKILTYDEEQSQIEEILEGYNAWKGKPRIRGYEIQYIRY